MSELLGIDPGVTTGFCRMSQNYQATTWQANTQSMSTVWDELESAYPSEIVYEDFKHRPNLMKAELHSVKVIGVIELWAETKGIPIVGKYLPADCKAFWTNDKIRRLGLYTKGVPHGIDALRVCLRHKGMNNKAFMELVQRINPLP
jgi:hypothetical protein